MMDLNVLLRGRKFFQLENARLMESKIVLLANQLSEVIRKDEVRCDKFVENDYIRTKHRLPETFLQFNNLSLLIAGQETSHCKQVTI